MADLDYAFLADHASVEGGKLSVIGASYTHGEVKGTSSLWVTSIAGRVRMQEGESPVELEIRISSPEGAYELVQTANLEPGPEARPYSGKIGVLFASGVALPVLQSGLYEVLIYLDGVHVRRLAFDIAVAGELHD